jgi:hypothetical protein
LFGLSLALSWVARRRKLKKLGYAKVVEGACTFAFELDHDGYRR